MNAASKLIRIEETGASLPEAQRAPKTGTYTLTLPAAALAKIEAAHFEGDVARAAAWAASPRWTRSRWCACPTR